MLFYFGKAKLIFFGAVILAIGIWDLTSITINDMPIFTFGLPRLSGTTAYLLFSLWTVAAAIIATRYALNRYNKILGILLQECDPERYCKTLQRLFYQSIVIKPFQNSIKLSIATGLLECAKYEEAYMLLKEVEASAKLTDANQIAYYNILAALNLRENKLSEAIEPAENMQKLMSSPRVSPKTKQLYIDSCISMQYILNIKQGNYDDAEEFFIGMFRRAKTNYHRVSTKLTLGKIYMHYGKIQDAKESFEYVVAHGNKLLHVAEAKEHLDNIA